MLVSNGHETLCKGCSASKEPDPEARFIDSRIALYKGKPGSLIAVLQETQREFGYLSESAIRRIGTGLGEPVAKVFGVVTFYSFFSRKPRGTFLVRVCMGTACYVRGALEVLDAFKKELNIETGQTTPDKLFTLDVARCFGTCGLAPAVMINETVLSSVSPAKVRQIVKKYRTKEPVYAEK
jgi:NADH:ubiquinone oxidoreductase subunit E